MNKEIYKSFARENRKNLTQAESVFWKRVRNRKLLGLKFYRQYLIPYKINSVESFFIADFYCHKHKLIIELEGKIHCFQKEYDRERRDILEAMGFHMLRVDNEVILHDFDEFILELVKYTSLYKP